MAILDDEWRSPDSPDRLREEALAIAEDEGEYRYQQQKDDAAIEFRPRYARIIGQIAKEFLKGRLQECVFDTLKGEVVAVTGDDAGAAEKIARLLNADEARGR